MARCKTCQKAYSCQKGNTTPLWRHAKKDHPKELRQVFAGVLRQPTLFQTLQRKEQYAHNSARKKQLDDALVKMVAKDLQPLSMVDDQGFLEFCHAMDPKYKVPSRPHLTGTLLPNLFLKTQGEIKKSVLEVQSLSLTCDLWTSVTNDSFMAVTCHYWDEEAQELKSPILDCAGFHGRHTGDRIREELRRCIKDFGIQGKILALVTDNGSNIVKAAADMGVRRLSCAAHTLNLVVTNAIETTEQVQRAKEQCSKIVTITKQSTVAKEELLRCQQTLALQTTKRLIQECPTRWNSVYEMLARLQELKESVSLLLLHPTMKSVGNFGPDQWDAVEEAVEVLRPCYEATLEFSAEKFASASKEIPLAKMMMMMYAAKEREAPEGSLKKELSGKILRNLNDRFGKVEETRVFALASLLDCRFKNKCFRSEEKKKRALGFLSMELKELYKEGQESQVDTLSLNLNTMFVSIQYVFFFFSIPAPNK